MRLIAESPCPVCGIYDAHNHGRQRWYGSERRELRPGSWILLERDELGWTDERFDGLADLIDDMVTDLAAQETQT